MIGQMRINHRVWDNNPEDDNLEDGTLHLEELEAELYRDDVEASAAPPHTGAVPPSTGSSAGASASATPRYHTVVPLQI